MTVTSVSADGQSLLADVRVRRQRGARQPNSFYITNPTAAAAATANGFAMTAAKPLPPTTVTATAGDGKARVMFSGANGLQPQITGFKVEVEAIRRPRSSFPEPQNRPVHGAHQPGTWPTSSRSPPPMSSSPLRVPRYSGVRGLLRTHSSAVTPNSSPGSRASPRQPASRRGRQSHTVAS